MPALHHTGFTVADLDRALAFWCGALGMELLFEQEAEGGYFGAIIGEPDARCRAAHLAFPGGGPRLELFEFLHLSGARAIQPRQVVDVGFAHVCVSCDDLDALLARLEHAGGRRRSDPVEIDRGANRGARAVYVHDPDGNVLELLQPPART